MENPVVAAIEKFVVPQVEFIDAIKRLCREVNRLESEVDRLKAELLEARPKINTFVGAEEGNERCLTITK